MSKQQQARRDGDDDAGSRTQRLPEECLAMAICLTSPADACRAAVVSAAFRSAADSDAVWERFLPPDCDAIQERAVHLVDASSKKELFMDLSDEHILLDDGKMSFGLQRTNGAKCYMLSQTELGIDWINVDLYWRKRSDPDSRFSKVAELLSVCWFGVSGSISSKELSTGTHYAGYLVFKLTNGASGLASPSQHSLVKVNGQMVGNLHTVSLHPCDRAHCGLGDDKTVPHDHEKDDYGGAVVVVRYPRQRADGWMELEMGDFHTGDGAHTQEDDINVILREYDELRWKKGLIVEGIEIRPRN
ncbi:putative F-box protein PP2-B2 [Lolium rigidum]|uniref:putative F-box protein PP2-B2 n=1 Tax=Lolium rigidum TaxID=89674 RepID=UPI001F5CF608|nr:putative F-box protein PP2-B2 [Lolium rigidum]